MAGAPEERREELSTIESPTTTGAQINFEVTSSPGATVAKDIHYNVTYHTGSISPLDTIKARSVEALEDLKKKPFVATRAAKQSLQRIKESYFVCIEGKEVSGKTSLGYYLLRKLGRQKYIPIILNGPEDYQWLLPDELYVILIDDIFGKSAFSTELFDQWNRKLADVFRRVKAGKDFLILTSHEGFFEKGLCTISVEDIFEKKNKVVLRPVSLRNYERFEILEKLAQHLRQPRDTKLLTETVLINQRLWFFHCCKLLMNHRKPLKNWPKFFEYPVSIIFNQVQKLLRSEPVKIATLLLIMQKGCVQDNPIDHLEKLSPELLQKISPHLTLTDTDVQQAVSSMDGSLLATERGRYTFLHDVVRDAVCFTFWDIDPTYSIRWFPPDFLVKHLAIESNDPLQQIKVPRECFKEVNERLQQIFDGEIPSYENFQTEAFGKLFLELHLRFNNAIVNLHLVSVLVVASVLFRFSSLLSKCLEVWQQQAPSKDKTVLEHLTVSKLCEKKAFQSADLLAEAGYRACTPPACEVCSTTDIPRGLLSSCLSEDENEMNDDGISNILKWVVHSSSIDVVSDFFKCIDSRILFEVCTVGMRVSCEVGSHEMFENFRCMAGGKIDNFDDLVESAVKGGNAIMLFYLVHEFKRVRVTRSSFQQACELNRVELAKMIWEDVPEIRRNSADQSFQEKVLKEVVSHVDNDCEELLGWLLSIGFNVNDTTVLHYACQYANRKAVAFLLQSHINVNTLNDKGNTALHVLCMSENLNFDVFEQLLTSGADANIRNKKNMKPLHLLCANQHPVRSLVLKLLLQNMNVEKLNDADIKGDSPLYILLDSGFIVEEMELLLESNADVSMQNRQGETPLHAACRSRNRRAVEMLVESKVDIYAKDKNGSNCLHHAVAELNNIDTINYILKQPNSESLLQPDNSGNTPLHFVMKTSNNEGAATVLLNHGANVLAENNDGITPFHIACSISNENSHRFIKSQEDHCSRACKMTMKKSPLHLACRSNGESAIPIVAQLLEWDADINGVDEEGKTPLHSVCESATHISLGIAQELCAREASIEILDQNGNTPLHLACQSQGSAKIGIILHMINQGASPLQRNNAGECPMVLMNIEGAYDLVRQILDSVLHEACQSEDVQKLNNVEDALSLGIDFSKVYDNSRPLMLRVCGEHGIGTSCVVRLVLKAGYDVNVTDDTGRTAVHAACGNIGPYTVAVLKVLHCNGCSMSRLDVHARTPLHVAVDSEDNAVEDVLDFLLNPELEVNSVDADGNTPLHIVCGSEKLNLRRSIHWLLNHYANVTITNHNGETCLDVAWKQDMPYLKETLMNEFLLKYCLPLLTHNAVDDVLEAGADINCSDFEGNTIIHNLVLKAGEIDVRDKIELVKSLGGDLRMKNNDDKTAYEIALQGDAEESLLQSLYYDENPREIRMSASGDSPEASEKTKKSSRREEIVDDIANFVKNVLKIFD